jgi:DNA-binding MurR/RpiR family transcriptional regulator
MNFGKSPIDKYNDIVLFTASEEIKYTIFGMSSRIAQLAIIDSIYTYIILNKSDEGKRAVNDTERALQSKKY